MRFGILSQWYEPEAGPAALPSLNKVPIPSKTQLTRASGKAILVAAGGDLADLVRTHQLGLTATSGDVQSISAAIRKLLSEGAELGLVVHHLYEARFSIARTTSRTEALLSTIADRPRRGMRQMKPPEEARR